MLTYAHNRRYVLLFALGVILLTAVPYLVGFASEGDSWRFTGFVFGVDDGNSYIAKMMTGYAGNWLLYTPYAAQQETGVFVLVPYILLGKLASPPELHLQLVMLYQLFRAGAVILYVLASYDMLSLFIQPGRLRWLALSLITLGGGLGWLQILFLKDPGLTAMPLDFYSPETFGFLSVYGLPHLAAARALMLWGLLFYLKPPLFLGKLSETRSILIGGGLLFVASVFQPLAVLSAWLVMAAHIALMGLAVALKRRSETVDWQMVKRYLYRAFWIGLISCPIPLYSVVSSFLDPFMQTWSAQNRILSPGPVYYLLAYAVVIPFAVAGAVQVIRRQPVQAWLLAGWVAVLPMLAYFPHNLQRRLPDGVWAAWVILAIMFFQSASFRLKRLQPILLLAFPTTLILLTGGILAASAPKAPVFRSSAETRAYEFLQSAAKKDDVVLSAYSTGNTLPGWSPVRVVMGHTVETPHFPKVEQRVKAFFSPETEDSQRIALLREFNVRYVFWGPEEKALGGWQPGDSAFLQMVYDQDGYQIFEVALEK